MRRLKRIFQSTVAKIISASLVISIALSGFFFFDFYLIQYNKIKGYWWVFQGDKALKKQDLQNAIYCYEKGIKLHPGHYKAMYNLANIYVVYEDYYSALKNYKKALLIRPQFEIARIDYAIILSQTYKTDEAIEEYKKVIQKRPKFYKIPFIVDNKKSYTYNKGVAYYNMGLAYRTKSLMAGLNKKTSREYLKKASESYEQSTEILNSYNSNYNLGLIHQLLRNQHQAGYYYCKAIAINPMEYEAHFNLAVLLNDLKNYKGATEEFKKAGLLLDSKGDSTKTRYIYDILSDVNQKSVVQLSEQDFKNLRLEQDLKNDSQYKAGKLVINYSKDKKEDVFLKNFAQCAGREIFTGEE